MTIRKTIGQNVSAIADRFCRSAQSEGALIVTYRPAFASDFARLNRAWLERYFTVEPLDEEYLGDPEGHTVNPGGEIFFAVEDGRVLGTTNSTLVPALRIYEALGFRAMPFPGKPPYIDADVYMELDLARRT